MLGALGEAHRRGLIHRDLKPDNLMVVPGPDDDPRERRIKILDFGIAKVLAGERAAGVATRTGVVLGTPAYLGVRAGLEAAPRRALAKAPEDRFPDARSMAAALREGLRHSERGKGCRLHPAVRRRERRHPLSRRHLVPDGRLLFRRQHEPALRRVHSTRVRRDGPTRVPPWKDAVSR